ncbi:MAG: type III pantothenate kinase [Deltaproteobacteria bacterium]|nr:type III pantothenate kinase [Deltaproteobacteria bacterium]
MLLVIDVGNTNTVIGVFKKTKLIKNWRIRTERNATEDEFNILISNLFAQNAINPANINRTIISCVVPPVIENLDAFCKKHLKHNPHWVDAKSTAQMPILYGNPDEVGADRIVNAVAAFHLYKQSLIVIDFGTGAISPGIGIASESLFKSASKLPRVELMAPPDNVIGKDTINSIKSGIIFGYAGLVDGIVYRMKKEMGSDPKVIATGGLAVLLSNVSKTIEDVEPDLTLNGLRIIADSL